MQTESRPLRIAISSLSGCGNTTATLNVGRTLGLKVVNYTFRDLASDIGLSFEEIHDRSLHNKIFDYLADLNQIRLSLQQ